MKKCDENEINVLLYIWGFGRIPLSFEHIKWKDPQHPEGCEKLFLLTGLPEIFKHLLSTRFQD